MKKIDEISERFINAMNALSVTGYRLSKDGVIGSQATMTKIKNGLQKPSMKTINALCEVYGVRKTWILTGEGPMFISQVGSLESEPSVLVGDTTMPSKKEVEKTPTEHIENAKELYFMCKNAMAQCQAMVEECRAQIKNVTELMNNASSILNNSILLSAEAQKDRLEAKRIIEEYDKKIMTILKDGTDAIYEACKTRNTEELQRKMDALTQEVNKEV